MILKFFFIKNSKGSPIDHFIDSRQ